MDADVRAAGPRIYHGRLAELLPSLSSEAMTMSGRWASRLLPHGALVSVRIQDGRRVLRIARATKPEGSKALGAFRREVCTFLTHFGAEDWPSLPSEGATGIAVMFQEPGTDG